MLSNQCVMASKVEGVFPLKGVVQYYAWGGKTYLSELFGIDNPDQSPMAEYWVGVHPRGISQIEDQGEWKNLSSISQVPFLLKILDVNQMLSIQSHPNKKQAEIGFAKEEAEGIPRDAKHRIFKDDNHKPELMVALNDFWLLHGFKSIEKIKETFSENPEFKVFEGKVGEGIEPLYTYLMNLDEDQIVETLSPLKERLNKEQPSDKDHPDYWANLAFDDYGFDRGIFSIYLYNLVHLKFGEAIYQEAGVPHAYLEGRNIEIMANSDNVFRAGLTPKHMDVEVLLAHLDFDPVTPLVIHSSELNTNEKVYKSPAKEFEIKLISVSGEDYGFTTPFDECFIVLSGNITVVSARRIQSFGQGDCFFCSAEQEIIMKSEASAEIVRATLPA